jgi:hypothetical protein
MFQEKVAKKGQLPRTSPKLHEFANVQRINTNARVCLGLKTHRSLLNRYIVAAICSILDKRSPNSCAIQRPFKCKFKAILAQSLSAERVMYAERVPKHFEHTRSYEVRILPAMELMGEVELPNYTTYPIELRRR